MEQKISIRELFLTELVKEFIKNAKPQEFTAERINPEVKEELQMQISEKPISQQYISPEQIMQLLPESLETPRTKIEPRILPPPHIQMSQVLPITPKVPLVKPSQGNPDLGKLNFLIADPRVEDIECPGPSKNILVTKGNSIQRTALVLAEEEIKNIIEISSQMSRIPMIKGTLKATLGNLIITAVTSDFVGSRFIVQKKIPK